jgi:DNA-binding CsgD family transcriptional regulator
MANSDYRIGDLFVGSANDELTIANFRRDGAVVLSNGSVLTPGELEILEFLASGARNREIAAGLFLSVHTVEYHVTHILQKLGVRNRTEASIKAARLGLSMAPDNVCQTTAIEPGGRVQEAWVPARHIGRRLVVPLLVALNGLLLYLAVLGSPFDSSADGPANAVAQASPAPSGPATSP